ncbi:unnamed protein product [Echinostoma caproni]|uniref:poly(ADP-ribose) glycohydrolase n=1 Tax=Echinostoma caproni TaxID=27848 RepID=A0A183BFK1_9TREM|nr:unnamed protein product [Echinostoma caproni]
MTFIGLGNFIHFLKPKEQKWLRDILFPFIFRCAMNIEKFNTETLPYCFRYQEYNVSIPFDLAVSIVACSFMCLLPTHPTWSLLMNEANFTYFFASITDATCPQAQKLRRLFAYFEHCRLAECASSILSTRALRITRRVLPVTPPPPVVSSQNFECMRLCGNGGKRELVRAMSSVSLPYMLVDAYRSVEAVAHRLQIPMTHFVNAYVGGNVLRSDGPTDDSLFMRYPDLLTCLPLCHRLEDAEALWIDHFRGPFVENEDLPSDDVVFNPDKLKWRRLVCMNTSCFPNWAAELQYSDAYLINEITKACAAFFGVSQSTVMAVRCLFFLSKLIVYHNPSRGHSNLLSAHYQRPRPCTPECLQNYLLFGSFYFAHQGVVNRIKFHSLENILLIYRDQQSNFWNLKWRYP